MKKGSFNAWLYRIVVNKCFDYLRKYKQQARSIDIDIADGRYPEKFYYYVRKMSN